MSDQLYAIADCETVTAILFVLSLTEYPFLCRILVCLIPMGLPVPSVGPQIAECQKVLEKSGLEYKVRLSAWKILFA